MYNRHNLLWHSWEIIYLISELIVEGSKDISQNFLKVS